MRGVNVLLALFVSVLIGFAIFEVGLRFTNFAPEHSGNVFDAELGWAKQPGAELERSRTEFDVHIEINELGLRDDPMASPAKPDGVYRVVVLGDSFTMGYTVERRDLFVDLLEDWWQAEGRAIEIVNAGVEGYSTDQSARWLQLHGADFQPDLVIHFPYENDIYWNGQKSYLRYPKPRYMPSGRVEARQLEEPAPRRWTQNWATTKALGALAGLIRSAHQGPEWFTPEGGSQPMLREFAPLLIEPPAFLSADPENPLGRTRGALMAMKGAAEKAGAKLLVVPIPSHSDVDAEYAAAFGRANLGLEPEAWDPSKSVDLFLDTCRELGIKSLDVRSTFKALIADGRDLYYHLDWHLDPGGNRALARYLYNELDSSQNGILPASLAAKTPLSNPPIEPKPFPPFWLVLYGVLVVVLTALFKLTYPKEALTKALPMVAGMLALVFLIFMGARALVVLLPPSASGLVVALLVIGVITFLVVKLGRRLDTVFELIGAFIKRGHWYLLPLLVVLLSIGSLLVVAASSPFVAPFIYTLF